jgi:hypothetical protein
MHYQLERLVSGGRNEVSGKEIEVLIADGELVLAALIPSTKAGSAYLVRYIELVKPVRASRALEQCAHPRPTAGRIRGEVEHN